MMATEPLTEDRRRRLLAAVAISLAVALALYLVRAQGLLQPLELAGYDLGVTLGPGTSEPAPVTLVLISENDIQALGRWPVPDRELAAALEAILANGPAAVGVDIYRDVSVPPGSNSLQALLAGDDRLIGIFKFPGAGTPGVSAPPALAATDRVGFSDLPLDADSIVRRGLAFMDDGAQTAWAFSLRVALRYLDDRGVGLGADPAHPERFMLGPTTFEPLPREFGAYTSLDNAGYQFMVDFSRDPRDFPRVSLGQLRAGAVPPELIRGRVVLVGVDAESVKDSFATPETRWPWSASTQISGVAMHGIIIDQLIRASRGASRPFSAWPPALETVLLVLCSVIGALLGLASRSVARLVVITLTGVLALTGTGMLLFLAGQWFPVALTSLGLSLSAGLTTAYLVQATRRERAALQKILSLQVSPDVAEEIWRRREELIEQGGLKPQHVTATVMFVDLQGFTPLTEALSSDELMDWLNPIMELATRVVIRHGGMVDDYFGDGIKVNFGVPLPRDSPASIAEDAARALACARELIDEAAELSKSARAPYLLRFGIHTGDVITASVGSRERQKYTSIGDTVNVAGRLESLAKEISHSTRLSESCVVLSASTAELLGDEVPLSYLGPVSLRGRVQPVKAYRLVINQNTATDAVKEIEP